jgi:glycosyltransferase involved in cell wall biosynthesis
MIGNFMFVTLKDLLGNALAKEGAEQQVDYLLGNVGEFSGGELKELLLVAAKLIEPSNPSRANDILKKIIELGMDCASVHLGRSIVQHNLGDFDGSVGSLKAAMALELDPGQKALASVMLVKFGQLGLASSLARQAFKEHRNRISIAGNCLDVAMSAADWDFYDEIVPHLRRAYLAGDFAGPGEAGKTNILWCSDEYTNLRVIEAWAKKTYPTFADRSTRRGGSERERIRIGYLSSDYRTHPTAFLINGLLSNHDRSGFEIFGYCTGWDDSSNIRREIVSNCDHFFEISNMSDGEASELISSHDLDVLVELNGATKSNRMGVLSRRPCRNQICYLGWPGSVGGRFVDYIVADDYILPTDKADMYAEQIIWLDGTYQVNDHSRLGALDPVSREDYNLPNDRLILGMFNTINKVNREVWSVWMEILRRVPQAILWLLDPGPDARVNLANEASRWELDLDRVVIAPRLPFEQHVRRLQICDLVLDPWPIGGHTSAADALYAGVPLVVMRGTTYASRVGGSLLRAAGLEDLVQDDKSEYLSFAVTLLENPNELAQLKRLMRKNIGQSRLFNSLDKTRQFETVYRELSLSHPEDEVQGKLKPGKTKAQFAVCVFSPEGYVHSRAFDELSELICYGLRDNGYRCTVLANQFLDGGINILLGSHLLPEEHHCKIPTNSIIFNTEPLDSIRVDWANRIKSLSRGRIVWDYSSENSQFFISQGLKPPLNFKYGYQAQLDRLPLAPQKDIDILFYGSLNERRKSIISSLEKEGLRIKSVFGVYGAERDALISRSRIVLNLKASETNPLEEVRIFYLLMNGVAIVSESDSTVKAENFACDYVKFFHLDSMAGGLKALLSDESALEWLRSRARQAFGGKSQGSQLRSLVLRSGVLPAH